MKIVLFDLGNVLVDNHFDHFYGMMSESCGCSPARLQEALEGDIMIQLETGRISMEEYIIHCKREFKLAWEKDVWREKYQSSYSLNAEGHKIRKHLISKGVPVAVLSNLAEYHMMAVQNGCPEVLTGNVKNFYSYEIGLHKPDTRIYEHVCSELKMKPSDIFFLDDKLENVEGAEKIGMRGMQFVPENYQGIWDLINKIDRPIRGT
jgi:glucose-1-phosphatase